MGFELPFELCHRVADDGEVVINSKDKVQHS